MKKMIPGRHKFVCAVDGMVYYSEDKRIRWDGAIVYKKNLESRHPQELIKSVKEDISIENARFEKGYGSDQANDYTFSDASRYPTFGLVDEFFNLIITDNEESIQVPPTLAVLS